MNILLLLLAALHSKSVQKDHVCPNVQPGDPSSPAPFFPQSVYSFPVYVSNLPLGKVRAYSDWTSQILYSLVGTDDVSIDRDSGELRVRSMTRPDRLPYQTFFAVATDSRWQSATATVKVNFTRIDFVPQKRPPIFSSQPYRLKVSPNTEPGTKVFKVFASVPLGKTVIYRLVNSTYFAVNSSTGELYLAQRLPNVTSLSFIVSAEFESEPDISSQSLVHVSLDFSPPATLTFPRSWYNVNVSSGINRDEVVTVLEAVTEDASQQGLVRYSMSGSESFRIDSITGFVRVDRLPLPDSTLVRVIASTGTETARTIVSISKVCPLSITTVACPANPCLKLKEDVTPACEAIVNATCMINKCGSCFAEYFKDGNRVDCSGSPGTKPINKAVHEVSIREEGPLNSLIVDLYQLDRGFRPELGPQVSFSLEDTFNGTFAISDAGKVFNLKRLDFDNGKHFYDLAASIKVTTLTSYSFSRIPVSVTVLNINDNYPMFTSTLQQLTLSTSLNVGDPIYKANAVDLDKGDRLSYLLKDGSQNAFQVDLFTGVVSLTRSLQQGENFSLLLEASDNQTPIRYSTMRLDVLVDNSVPNRPVFPYHFASFRLSENNPVLSLIKTIPASFGEITYDILEGTNEDGIFQVDNKANLRVIQVLDRESVQNVYCVLSGTDQSSGITSYVQIFLEVTDLNDNSPVWPFHIYRVDLHRNTAIGTEIFREEARDIDLFPVLAYSVTGGGDLFTVSSEDDEVVIRLGGPLPTTVSYIALSVYASDGIFSRRTTVGIYLH